MTSKPCLRKKVIVAYPVTVPWMALFVKGVAEYAERHGGWNLTISPPTLAGAEWRIRCATCGVGLPTGCWRRSPTRPRWRAAQRLGIPVVNFSGAMRHADLPRVMVDHYAIGRLAAEHLLERGHRRLAYYGLKGLWYSQQRCLGFVRRAEQAGAAARCSSRASRTDPARLGGRASPRLVRWLQGSSRRSDCWRFKIIVPESCWSCSRHWAERASRRGHPGRGQRHDRLRVLRPTLSSVSRSGWRMGYEAAALLDGLMAGKSPPPHDILIPPRRRRGTAIDRHRGHRRPARGRGRAFHARPRPRTVQHRASHEARADFSPPVGTESFRRVFGCTPLDYLCRLRVEQVKDLLAAPQRVKLEAIAARCGFASEERMRLVFRRLTGTTPLDYRRDRQAHEKAVEPG